MVETPSAQVSRRAWLGVAGTTAAAALAACGSRNTADTSTTVTVSPPAATSNERPRPQITDAAAALDELVQGNDRFVTNRMTHPDLSTGVRMALTKGQKPFAVVLSCSDSRVPPEVVFDQGLGDLFTVRVAGNIVDAAVLGSIQYAVQSLSTPLIVVIGHQNCGAVTAALKAKRGIAAKGDLASIAEAIASAITVSEQRPGDPLNNAIIANAEQSRDEIMASPDVQPALGEGALKVIVGYESLESGNRRCHILLNWPAVWASGVV